MLGYVVYEALLVFTVDLEKGEVIAVEFCDDMSHVDTGLDRASPTEWRHLHTQARAVVERQPRTVQPRWAE